MWSLPQDVLEVMKRLFDSGFNVWVVGGALRDSLMKRDPKDWDLATEASPKRVVELFSRVVPVGIRHGTVQVLTAGRSIEVTSTPAPGVEGIMADLGRRDFTVNALALTYPGGELLDPYQGLRDIEESRLRAVGDARARFREDPLRTLRAARFVGTHGFTVEPETFEALEKEAEGLGFVARERIRDEMLKMLVSDGVLEAFECMLRAGVLKGVLPELVELSGKPLYPGCCDVDFYRHITDTVRLSPPRIRVRLAALFHDMAGPGEIEQAQDRSEALFKSSAASAFKIMTRWSMSNREIRDMQVLLLNQLPLLGNKLGDAALRRFISRVGLELLEDALDLATADRLARPGAGHLLKDMSAVRARIKKELERGFPLSVADLAVSGREIMQVLDLKPGPGIGKVLELLHARVLESPELNERKILMDFLEKEFHIEELEGIN